MIDNIDLEIIKLLRKNARMPYNELARYLGLSDVTIMRRVRKLERLGIIRKYVAVIDPSKLGYRVVSVTGIDVEADKLFEVVRSLKEKDYVKYLALTAGDHQIIAVIWASSSNELAKIHEEISSIEGVKRVCPALVLSVVKELTS